MGEVVGAGLISHAPTIMFDEATRREINDGNEISLVPGLVRLRREVLDRLRPDTIVIIDSHWETTVEHVLAAQARRHGIFTSSELPRGMAQIPYDFPGDPELARLAASLGDALGTPTHASEDDHLPVYYATINLLHYLRDDEKVVSVSLVQTGETDDFMTMGEAIGEAIGRLDRRAVVLASGGMSHNFWPLKEISKHEASDPVHIFTPEARAADEEEEDAAPLPGRIDRPRGPERQELRQGEAREREGARVQEVPPGHAVAEADRPFGVESDHGASSVVMPQGAAENHPGL